MTTYANTIEIPSVSPTGTGGAMIIDNFKTLADITCKTGTEASAGVTIGKDCATNSVTGSGSVIVGGYNCKASIQNAVVTNMDRSTDRGDRNPARIHRIRSGEVGNFRGIDFRAECDFGAV